MRGLYRIFAELNKFTQIQLTVTNKELEEN